MILMAYEKGDLAGIRPFLSDDVLAAFSEEIGKRDSAGLTIESHFVGLRELSLQNARFDSETKEGEISVRFVGELTSVVRNKAGEIVEGSPTAIKRQRDLWTFARRMGVDDPNWRLVETGD
jgi:predicted lipid-binding transport protein (Tim44 family)